jgi:serine/threonine protein kinase
MSHVTSQKAQASRAYLESHYLNVIRDVSSGGRTVGPRQKQLRLEDFQILRVIGRGAFGEVFIGRRRDDSGEVYAIKSMRKADMVKRQQVFHIRSERNVLAEAGAENPWLVQLFYSFEEADHLVMVMEYMPGGDLMTWLCSEEVFTGEQTKFYMAELCLAVNAVHEMKYVHRDIKPDNILLDAKGHMKLSDFGLCKSFDDAAQGDPDLYAKAAPTSAPQATGRRERFLSVVGSPGYIAPEILLHQPYSAACDWWSVGVIMYECLYGCPPFYSEDNQQTCYMITKWREFLDFPDARRTRYPVTAEAVDLMKRLLCDQDNRIGFEEIKRHPFFAGINWETIREQKAAFTPKLDSPSDAKYFPTIEARRREAGEKEDRVTLANEDPRGVLFAGFNFSIDRRRHGTQPAPVQ